MQGLVAVSLSLLFAMPLFLEVATSETVPLPPGFRVPSVIGPHGNPDQAVPLMWSAGDSIEFRNMTIRLAPGTLTATDGETFLYVTTDPSVSTLTARDACLYYAPPPDGIVAALVDSRGCQWAMYPGISCSVDVTPCQVAANDGPHRPPEQIPEWNFVGVNKI